MAEKDMGLFNRSTPRDTNALYAALTHGTLAEVEKVYEQAWANYEFESGTPLTLALTNKDTTQRVAIANRLLDDGADVRYGRPLHVLLGRNQHDFTACERRIR